MAEPRVHGSVRCDQLFPDVRGDDLHLFGQWEAAALPKELARGLVQAMFSHHLRERLLDQRIAVNQRAVEVEDEPTRMPIAPAGSRLGSKKRFWFGCHVINIPRVGWARSPGGCAVD